MTVRLDHRRAFLQVLLGACVLPVRSLAQRMPNDQGGVVLDTKTASYHVYPEGQIQDALEAAARDPLNKTIYVHAGTYRPPAKGQALVWFNARHDGITLEAVGDVVLTAANPKIADNRGAAFPAVVNHVVYFGDGVSSKTVLRGFRITGANNFTFSRKELDDALRDPNQLSYLGQIGMPPGGGVRMEQAPPGSLAQKLGLQPGDIIKKVNGQPVASTGDLARLYTQFNTLSSIQAEVQRGSSTTSLSYSINP